MYIDTNMCTAYINTPTRNFEGILSQYHCSETLGKRRDCSATRLEKSSDIKKEGLSIAAAPQSPNDVSTQYTHSWSHRLRLLMHSVKVPCCSGDKAACPYLSNGNNWKNATRTKTTPTVTIPTATTAACPCLSSVTKIEDGYANENNSNRNNLNSNNGSMSVPFKHGRPLRERKQLRLQQSQRQQ